MLTCVSEISVNFVFYLGTIIFSAWNTSVSYYANINQYIMEFVLSNVVGDSDLR